jgi:hypothetical protein
MPTRFSDGYDKTDSHPESGEYKKGRDAYTYNKGVESQMLSGKDGTPSEPKEVLKSLNKSVLARAHQDALDNSSSVDKAVRHKHKSQK